MALRRFLFGMNQHEFTKYRILFVNGDKAGLIPENQLEDMFKIMEKLFIKRSIAFVFSGVFAFSVPVPLDLILKVPVKFVIFSLSYRGLIYKSKVDLVEKMKNLCIDLDLENKVDEMQISVKEKKILDSILEAEKEKRDK
ncbi:hypothetical protein SteCoe_36550 [Stentor coeruleus]|uniref:Uncharacterized protein n=1 Tax=Stentor coeruleus TaxID=5963 RepID=A0A1R2APU2_9CILI|nr:hypothetical protein SteCoe_36550 [Stentor coeruleus]